ncbi:phage tail protein [Variovorax sp. J2P1-59]|uniref:phage tail protein n=1 Tax=Variovorax flavidus TaxID=3053501 RepID=UPI002575AC70|nr:phage tail protein [Variovorax sp. J2P1-59]MDM0076902.1 phage tail protein [Variovorax sp. J2P1-59]
MSVTGLKAYRFTTPAHWKRCVRHRLGVTNEGGLRVEPPLGTHAVQAVRGALLRVAAGRRGVRWSTHGDTPSKCLLQTSGGMASDCHQFQSVAADRLLAQSPRWILEGEGLWGFGAKSLWLQRVEADSLAADSPFELGSDLDLRLADRCTPAPRRIVDIAGDGGGGLWVLAELGTAGGDAAGPAGQRCERVNAAGCVIERWQPEGAKAAREMVSVDGGRTLVLLSQDGASLSWARLGPMAFDGDADADDMASAVKPVPVVERSVETLAPGWRVKRMSSDGCHRIALWLVQSAGGSTRSALMVLDADGGVLHEAAPDVMQEPVAFSDLAVQGDVVWIATRQGLWRLDGGPACGRQMARGLLITPVLDSPPGAEGRGWLRAELRLSLPPGARLVVEAAGTDDELKARDVRAWLERGDLPLSQRWERLWHRSQGAGFTRLPAFRMEKPGEVDGEIAVPLFRLQQRWMWLGIEIVMPPGVPMPELEALAVRYPDRSLMAHLPEIFRCREGDPEGLLRGWVGVIETMTQGLDERIGAIGAGIDPETAPAARLDELAGWLGLPWDERMAAADKRALLKAAGGLMASRGTRQGLRGLLHALLGASSCIGIEDRMVDHPPDALGGRTGPGPALPLVIAGAPRATATLGERARVGLARLPGAGAVPAVMGDPLRAVAAVVHVDITTTPKRKKELASALPALLAQFLPAGVRADLHWHTRTDGVLAGDGDTSETADVWRLDGLTPGRLGEDQVVGRSALDRGRERRLDEGTDLGFRLR